MKTTVLFFGYLTERLGMDRLEVEADSLAELKTALFDQFPQLSDLGCLYAVDQEVVVGDMALAGGEEIAVMPPFAGG